MSSDQEEILDYELEVCDDVFQMTERAEMKIAAANDVAAASDVVAVSVQLMTVVSIELLENGV